MCLSEGFLLLLLPFRPSPAFRVSRLSHLHRLLLPRAPQLLLPTPQPLQVIHATAVGDANVRAGPATDFTIINTVVKGEQVTIHSRNRRLVLCDTSQWSHGWMADIVLTINPRLVDAIPTATPTTTP